MDTTDLAKRMKNYEKNVDFTLIKRMPVIIRLDMRAGHTFTKGFQRPFDDIFIQSMQDTMQYLCENIENVKLGYHQSDEITLILIDYNNLETETFFNNRIQKICSISASMATLAFNKSFEKYVKGEAGRSLYDKELDLYCRAIEKGATFDARCFNIPQDEVTNLIYWRQLDAIRNSIQMVGRAYFSHKELMNKSCNDIQNMLIEKHNINWNDYPTYQKRGTCCIKQKYFVNEAGEKITNELFGTLRTTWILDRDIPIFKQEGRQYIDKLIYTHTL